LRSVGRLPWRPLGPGHVRDFRFCHDEKRDEPHGAALARAAPARCMRLDGKFPRRRRAARSSSSLTSRAPGIDESGSGGDMAVGKVKWFNDEKGWGFIKQESGPDVFVHYSQIVGEGRRRLFEDEVVEFEIKEGPKGLQAVNVLRQQGTAVAS